MTTWCETGEACVYRLPCGMCELFEKECNLKEPKPKDSEDDKKDKKDKIPSPGDVLIDDDDNFWIVLGVTVDKGLDLFSPIHGADFGVKIDAYDATGWHFDEWRYIFDALLKKQINLDD